MSVCMYVCSMYACMYVHTCECLYICSACMQDIHTNTYPFCRQVLRRAGFCRAQNCSYGLQPHQDSKDFEIFHAVTGSLAHLIGDLAPNACLLEETRCEGADLLVTSLTEAPLNVGFQGFSCKLSAISRRTRRLCNFWFIPKVRYNDCWWIIPRDLAKPERWFAFWTISSMTSVRRLLFSRRLRFESWQPIQ